MAFWWERYTNNPDQNTSSPPDGAPENHFPDQVNNIARQAMAAIAEIGEKVLGAGDGTAAPQANVSINGAFLKLMYDAQLPIGSIQAFDSGGTYVYPVPDDPAFSGVAWARCDGAGGVPDFENQALIGVQFTAGAGQNQTGDLVAAGLTSEQALQDLNAVSDPHTLIKAEMPIHNHGITEPNSGQGHQHTYTPPPSPTQGPTNDNKLNQGNGATANTSFSTTGITINDAGADGAHSHGISVDDVAAHDHTTGTPPGTALELYIRTA